MNNEARIFKMRSALMGDMVEADFPRRIGTRLYPDLKYALMDVAAEGCVPVIDDPALERENRTRADAAGGDAYWYLEPGSPRPEPPPRTPAGRKTRRRSGKIKA